MLTVLWLIVVVAVATGLTWKGSQWLEGAANRLSAYYGLPAVVQGAIVVAMGSSLPELASVILATLRHGAFELGVAAVIGSAIFNVLVIPAVSTLAQGEPLETNREVVYKEEQFYLLSVAALLLVFSLSVIYFEVGTDPIAGLLTRELALVLLALYGLYVFIQYTDVRDHEPGQPPKTNLPREWGLLVAGLVLIVLGVEGLIHASLAFGELFGTPAFLWGLIVIAAGTSIPDAFISIHAARARRHTVSLANVFGSNVFDLLVAIPAGVLLGGAMVINFDRIAPMMTFLIGATVVVFTASRTGMKLTNREAIVLLAIYGAFVLWMLAESTGLTGVLA